MAVEIVEEEDGGDQELQQENESIAVSCSEEDNGGEDALWTQIELAERYMVSGMYENAASTSCTSLGILSTQIHSSLIGETEDRKIENVEAQEGRSEYQAMLESTGMVLLQSYHALGRVGDFFDTLKSLDIGVAELPPTLLLSGACLQVSVGAFIAAQAALEEFLAVWGTAKLEDCGEEMDPAHQNSTVDKHSSKVLRMSENYGDIVEFYILQVLLKGLKTTESAVHWAERANLTEERRIAIMKKIQLHVEATKTTEPVANPLPKITSVPAVTSSINHSRESEIKTLEAPLTSKISEPPDHAHSSSLSFKSAALLKKLRIAEGFFSLRTFLELALARFGPSWSRKSRVLSIAALVSLFLLVFLGRQHKLRTLASKSFDTCKVGLIDFWRLAFSVQINPLAAVTPMYTGRLSNP